MKGGTNQTIRFERCACAALPRQKKTFASAIKRLWSKKTVQPWYLEFKNTKTVFS